MFLIVASVTMVFGKRVLADQKTALGFEQCTCWFLLRIPF